MNDVCAVVVTFNRKVLLLECLEALLSQTYPLKAIYVIDNASSDGTEDLLTRSGLMDRIFYHRLTSNTGGAGGFSYGLTEAFNAHHEGYWIMDDDAEPAPDALEKLISQPIPSHISALASTVYHGSRQEHSLQIIGHRGRFDRNNLFPVPTKPLDSKEYAAPEVIIDMASFVGLLIPQASIETIGFPDAKYFIHHDDTEYSLRLGTIGPILMRTESKIYHKEMRTQGRNTKSCLGMKKTRVSFDKLWIMYYSKRNTIEIARHYGNMGSTLYWRILKDFLLLTKDILCFDDHKLRRLHFAFSSVMDGITGTFENQKPKQILYKEE